MTLLPTERPAPPVVRTPDPATAPAPSTPVTRTGLWSVPRAVVAAALLGVLVLALLVGGGAPAPATPGLPDAGAVTGWGLPVAELLSRLLAVLTVGHLVYAALLVPAVGARPPRESVRALRAATTTGALWLVAEAAVLLLGASALYAVPVPELSASAVTAALTQLASGRAAAGVGVLVLLVVLGSAVATRLLQARALLTLALAAVVVPVVFAGHSAAADAHVATVSALTVHVVTASLWVGGLLALLLHGRGQASTAPAVRRFSTLALACVALLAGSGLLAALLVVGTPDAALLDAGYVRLLLAKTVALVALAGFGWWHRRRTLPALAAGRPRAFARLGAVELALMAVTVTVSVALAASPPPAPAAATTTTTTTAAPAATADAADPDPAAGPADPAASDPVPAADAAPLDPPPVAEDMSGHDHGDLSVSVLVDDERFHVAGTVRPGQRVTVYNSGADEVSLTADDGSFDAVAPSRTFITFEAPAGEGDYGFSSSHSEAFADTLRVRADR